MKRSDARIDHEPARGTVPGGRAPTTAAVVGGTSRRAMLTGAPAAVLAATGLVRAGEAATQPTPIAPGPDDRRTPLFRISLAQWSLHRTLRRGDIGHLDFPRVTRRTYGLGAVEYVNSFFRDRSVHVDELAELRRRCDGEGVESLLIMCDGLGRLGDPDDAARTRAIEAHRPWLDAATLLGCHSIRVNAASGGSREEQARLAADGLRRLAELGDDAGLNVIVENHGGYSSDGGWLSDVMRRVDHPRMGTLPDFGNFSLGGGRTYDYLTGVSELMPFARAVSAKSHDFGPDGRETTKDYRRLIEIVLDAGYRGWIGIEYEGSRLSEQEGVLATKRLLERVREDLARERAGA